MKIKIIHNDYHKNHKLANKPHPQRPQRIISILQCLNTTFYKNFIFTYEEILKNNQRLNDKQVEKITQNQIIKIHGKKYYDFVQGIWCQGISKPQNFINVDTYYIKQTFKAAFQAAKTSILMIQDSLNGEAITDSFFSLVRPPGHHSGLKNQPHGFSFFNNIALAANYYVQKTKKNAVIIDWDIHHGEGTQKIFYSRKDVLYISLHRFDDGKFFPHIKQSNCQFTGQKQGIGFNINIPWNFPRKQKDQKRQQYQSVGNNEYIYCFNQIIMPILNQYQFGSIFISCGFDCACGDPIGDSKITQQGFQIMTQMLKSFNKQIFIVLQGGYNVECLQKGTLAVLEGLQAKQIKKKQIKFKQLNEFTQNDIQKSLKEIKKYWKIS